MDLLMAVLGCIALGFVLGMLYAAWVVRRREARRASATDAAGETWRA